jgi:hypothetical protein
MSHFLGKVWLEEGGKDIAEYSVMPFHSLRRNAYLMGGPRLRIAR